MEQTLMSPMSRAKQAPETHCNITLQKPSYPTLSAEIEASLTGPNTILYEVPFPSYFKASVKDFMPLKDYVELVTSYRNYSEAGGHNQGISGKEDFKEDLCVNIKSEDTVLNFKDLLFTLGCAETAINANTNTKQDVHVLTKFTPYINRIITHMQENPSEIEEVQAIHTQIDGKGHVREKNIIGQNNACSFIYQGGLPTVVFNMEQHHKYIQHFCNATVNGIDRENALQFHRSISDSKSNTYVVGMLLNPNPHIDHKDYAMQHFAAITNTHNSLVIQPPANQPITTSHTTLHIHPGATHGELTTTQTQTTLVNVNNEVTSFPQGIARIPIELNTFINYLKYPHITKGKRNVSSFYLRVFVGSAFARFLKLYRDVEGSDYIPANLPKEVKIRRRSYSVARGHDVVDLHEEGTKDNIAHTKTKTASGSTQSSEKKERVKIVRTNLTKPASTSQTGSVRDSVKESERIGKETLHKASKNMIKEEEAISKNKVKRDSEDIVSLKSSHTNTNMNTIASRVRSRSRQASQLREEDDLKDIYANQLLKEAYTKNKHMEEVEGVTGSNIITTIGHRVRSRSRQGSQLREREENDLKNTYAQELLTEAYTQAKTATKADTKSSKTGTTIAGRVRSRSRQPSLPRNPNDLKHTYPDQLLDDAYESLSKKANKSTTKKDTTIATRVRSRSRQPSLPRNPNDLKHTYPDQLLDDAYESLSTKAKKAPTAVKTGGKDNTIATRVRSRSRQPSLPRNPNDLKHTYPDQLLDDAYESLSTKAKKAPTTIKTTIKDNTIATRVRSRSRQPSLPRNPNDLKHTYPDQLLDDAYESLSKKATKSTAKKDNTIATRVRSRSRQPSLPRNPNDLKHTYPDQLLDDAYESLSTKAKQPATAVKTTTKNNTIASRVRSRSRQPSLPRNPNDLKHTYPDELLDNAYESLSTKAKKAPTVVKTGRKDESIATRVRSRSRQPSLPRNPNDLKHTYPDQLLDDAYESLSTKAKKAPTTVKTTTAVKENTIATRVRSRSRQPSLPRNPNDLKHTYPDELLHDAYESLSKKANKATAKKDTTIATRVRSRSRQPSLPRNPNDLKHTYPDQLLDDAYESLSKKAKLTHLTKTTTKTTPKSTSKSTSKSSSIAQRVRSRSRQPSQLRDLSDTYPEQLLAEAFQSLKQAKTTVVSEHRTHRKEMAHRAPSRARFSEAIHASVGRTDRGNRSRTRSRSILRSDAATYDNEALRSGVGGGVDATHSQNQQLAQSIGAGFGGKDNVVLMAVRQGAWMSFNQLRTHNLVDIDYRTESRNATLLMEAANHGAFDIVASLIAMKCDINAVDNFGFTSTHYAAIYGYPHILKILIEAGGDVNAVDINGNTPLHHVVNTMYHTHSHTYRGQHCQVSGGCGYNGMKPNQYLIAKMIVEAGADVNIKNSLGYVPLHLVAQTGCGRLCKLLLRNGASTKLKTGDGKTANMLGNERIKALLRMSNSKKLNLDDDEGADEDEAEIATWKEANANLKLADNEMDDGSFTSLTRAERITALQCAIVQHDLPKIVRLMREQKKPSTKATKSKTDSNLPLPVGVGMDVGFHTGLDDFGNTLLHLAAMENDIALINYCINHDADINVRNKADATPLMAAIVKGSTLAVEWLICHAADLELYDTYGLTALGYSVLCHRHSATYALLHNGCSMGDVDYKGNSIFLLAAAAGDIGLLEALITRGINIHHVNRFGENALHVCVRAAIQHLWAVNKTNTQESVLAKQMGRSAISTIGCQCAGIGEHGIAQSTFIKAIEFLLDAGVHKSHMDEVGFTPMSIAAACNEPGVEAISNVLMTHTYTSEN